MIVLDAYAVLALLDGEPAATPVARLLTDSPGAALTPLGVAEVLDHLIRVRGVEEDEAVLDLAQLGVAPTTPLDEVTATRAGLLRARRYHRTRCAVSWADCVAAETARGAGQPLATADPHLFATCVDEGIDVIVLPDSGGVVWRPGS